MPRLAKSMAPKKSETAYQILIHTKHTEKIYNTKKSQQKPSKKKIFFPLIFQQMCEKSEHRHLEVNMQKDWLQ